MNSERLIVIDRTSGSVTADVAFGGGETVTVTVPRTTWAYTVAAGIHDFNDDFNNDFNT